MKRPSVLNEQSCNQVKFFSMARQDGRPVLKSPDYENNIELQILRSEKENYQKIENSRNVFDIRLLYHDEFRIAEDAEPGRL